VLVFPVNFHIAKFPSRPEVPLVPELPDVPEVPLVNPLTEMVPPVELFNSKVFVPVLYVPPVI